MTITATTIDRAYVEALEINLEYAAEALDAAYALIAELRACPGVGVRSCAEPPIDAVYCAGCRARIEALYEKAGV